MFFGYINYDWGDEKPGNTADWKTGSKKWQIYKEVHGWAEIPDQTRQHMKRKFYSENVDDKFETVMLYKNDDDRKDFMRFC